MCNYKQLRNMKACVCTNGFNYELTSYDTPVASLGYMTGEFTDDFGRLYNLYEEEQRVLLLTEDYDYSPTTIRHLRAFIEDYIGSKLAIADVRASLKSPDHLLAITPYGEAVYVYRCTWSS